MSTAAASCVRVVASVAGPTLSSVPCGYVVGFTLQGIYDAFLASNKYDKIAKMAADRTKRVIEIENDLAAHSSLSSALCLDDFKKAALKLKMRGEKWLSKGQMKKLW